MKESQTVGEKLSIGDRIERLLNACEELTEQQRSVKIGQATREERQEWPLRTAQLNAQAKVIAEAIMVDDLSLRSRQFESSGVSLKVLPGPK